VDDVDEQNDASDVLKGNDISDNDELQLQQVQEAFV